MAIDPTPIISINEYRTEEKAKKEEKKLHDKISKLQARVKELEAQQWFYDVGDVCLFDGWRRVTITHKIKDGKYRYLGTMEHGCNQVKLSPDRLSTYRMTDKEYIEKLLYVIADLNFKFQEELTKYKH